MAGEHLGLGGERSLSFCLVGAAAAHHTMGQGRWAKTAKGLASMKRAPAMAAFDIAQIPHLHNHRSGGGDDYAMKCLRLSRGSEPKHLRWRPPKTRAQGRDENVPKQLRSGTVYTWYQPFPIDESFICLSQRRKMLRNTTFRVNEAMPRLVGCFGTRSEAHVKALDLFAKYPVWSSGMRPRPPSGYQKPQHDCLLSVCPVTLFQVVVDCKLSRLYGSEMAAIKRLVRNLLNITGFFRLELGSRNLEMGKS
ncbi:hypothetical protein CMEL01_00652 [Colletotrichum melonis]|uniref:Uncharacterized protein n=1 Tax=Colletotrichum melonis TaxID=1209925 RepID=A0AAI9XZH3_9PEZI|nr:hypothetical protein CMEL01_00652 [Colletotrichum melonis]